MTTLAQTIRAARYKAGLSQKQVAAMTGMTGESIYKIERGNRKPYPYNLARIKAVLSIVWPPTPKPIPKRDPVLDKLHARLVSLGHCVPTKNKFENPFA